MAKPIIKPWQVTPEQEAKMRALDPTSAWLQKMPSAVVQRYANQWIAARGCEVVASGKTYGELLANLGNIDLETVIILHNETRKVIYR